MKKLTALLLSLILVFSLCSVSAFAEEATESPTEESKLTDAQITELFFRSFATLVGHDLLTEDEVSTILIKIDLDRLKNENLLSEELYKSLNDIKGLFLLSQILKTENTDEQLPNEYSFGQGTFVVGMDLKAGTYDITCETSSGSDMDNSMAGLSDFYASQGMSEYADVFNSMSGMYDTIGGLTVMTYKPNTSYYDQYLTLKVGETARIILEDGGKIEISDGTAKLVWIR